MMTGDLFELVGPSWRLPIRLKWIDALGEIEVGAGLSLLKCQVRAARDFLIENQAKESADRLFIFRGDLNKIARPAETEDPEEIVEWIALRKQAEVKSEFKSPDDFVETYCRSSFAVLRDPLIVDSIWLSFCKFMLHWMLNEQKEVNLGFARMIPLTLRRNWALCAMRWEWRKKKVHKILKSSYLCQDPESMVHRGVADFLVSTSVIAYEKRGEKLSDGLARTTVELVLNDTFYDTSFRVERARLAKCRYRPDYWRKIIADRMCRQLPQVMEAYAFHIRETRWPMLHFDKRNGYGAESKRDWDGTSRKVMEALEGWVADELLYPAGEVRDAQNLAQPDKMVPEEVPNIQPDE